MWDNLLPWMTRSELLSPQRVLTDDNLLAIADVQAWGQADAADAYTAERVERCFGITVVGGLILRDTVDGRHATEGCYEVG